MTKEKIDFGLKKTYAVHQLPEEEYCTIFSLISILLYWRKTKMQKKSLKLLKKMKKEFPIAMRVVKKHVVSSKTKKSSKQLSHRHITKQEVETLRDWIHQAIDS